MIELLLAMGMVAMLTLTLYVGMYTAFRAREVAIAQTGPMREAKIALDLVEQDLRSVLPPSAATTVALAGPFVGTNGGTNDLPSATLDCYSLGSDYGQTTPLSDGTRHVHLMLVTDTTTASTLTRYVTRDVLSVTAPETETQVLAENVVGFGVQYYDGAAWTDSWDSTQLQNALPLAAEVTIAIKAPTAADPNHLYRLARTITLPCGQTPDQAAANQAAIEAANGTATGTDGAQ